MTASTFAQALALVLAHEGGYVNHPRDPGGATCKGVTQRVYDAFRLDADQGLQSVRFVTPSECKAIYKTGYWDALSGDKLPAGIDYALFDFAVNSGVQRAAKTIQNLVDVTPDGNIGPKTLLAIRGAAAKNEELIIDRLASCRLAFLTSLPTFDVFGKGWTRRVLECKDYAIKFARADSEFVMPKAIGSRLGELHSAKAISNA